MSAETVDYYTLLCLTVRKHGWKLLLHSDHFGGKPAGDDLHSELTMLEVIDPAEGMIARLTLCPSDRLADAAKAVLGRMRSSGMLST